MREENDKLKIEADAQKLRAEQDIRLAELEIKREELRMKSKELEIRLDMERYKLKHASQMHNATLASTAMSDDDGYDFPSLGESPAERRMRELHELMLAPVEIEIDAATGKKRARRVVPSKVEREN
jgi:hypothetical protein